MIRDHDIFCLLHLFRRFHSHLLQCSCICQKFTAFYRYRLITGCCDLQIQFCIRAVCLLCIQTPFQRRCRQRNGFCPSAVVRCNFLYHTVLTCIRDTDPCIFNRQKSDRACYLQ